MRTNFFCVLFILLSGAALAQSPDKKNGNGKLAKPDMSVLDDSKTAPAKPAKATDTMNIIPPSSYGRLSIGANYGITLYTGDIPIDAMYPGYGGYLKYSFTHVFGLRLQYLQGQYSGAPTKSNNNFPDGAFKSSINNINLQAVFNLGSIDFRQSFPKNNFYFAAGLSRQNFKGSREKADTITNVTLSNNEVIFTIPLTIGYKRKVTKNFDVGAEFTYYMGTNDFLDLTSAGGLPDGNGYFVANVAYNFTSQKRKQHMDWANPVDKIYREIIEAKESTDAMKVDSDQDGVPDFLDKEPNTKKGYKVDSNGVTLDSDGDGIPDNEDTDPFGFTKSLGVYFPSGINGNIGGGVGGVIDSSERIYRLNDSVPQTEFVTISRSGYGLPTIIFPPNHFTVHVEQYALLQQIARILMVDTSASLVIIGHADNNRPNYTQLTLAEKRALEVKRKLYKVYEIDEKRMLVYSSRDPYVQKFQMGTEGLDRKVEFRIIRPVQKRQPRVDMEDMRSTNEK